MPAPKRFFQVVTTALTLASVLAPPLAPTMAQGPPAPPERLPPWRHGGRSPEARPWEPPVTEGRAETAGPTSLIWQIEWVDDPHNFSNMGQRSLALDAFGHPHIAYGEDHLYYAWHDGTSWISETVDSSGGVGQHTSLALDAAGRPHISYCFYDPGFEGCYTLKYAHFDGTSWQIETVDSGGVGYFTSLALDAAGRPHISYCDYDAMIGTCFDLKYAHFDGTSWQIETVDSWYVGGSTSLALDANSHPHISYQGDGLKYAHFNGTSWTSETVDNAGGGSTSLALDAGDHPHISYLDYTNSDLKYAHFDGSSWISETVDSAGSVGSFTSLALDAGDHPHISYLDYTNSDLKYAHFNGSSWISETVDSAGDVGRWTSLALDASDHPHISYCLYDPSTWTCDDLKYARFDGTSWISETVDSAGGYVGKWTSLALDANDHPHISYQDYTDYDLKYAHFDGASWQIETVDSGEWAGFHTSLALDANDHPHISYRGNGALKYAHFDGASWISETVDSTGGAYTSLALDANDHPHISYQGDGLKYAHFDGSSWLTETVDGAGSVGWSISLALDANDHPHISYCLFRSGFCFALAYAHFDGSSWLTETVDSAGYVGDFNSLALDAAGLPHISYYDSAWNYDLKYARFDGTSWISETVDSADMVGGFTSLALDASDHPHISYCSSGPLFCDDLKYAHFDGTSWISETVDSGYVGYYTSLALDTNDHPHISYYNGATAALKYAWGEQCVPVAGASIAGPAVLPVGQTGLYTATYAPPTATLPVTITWDNGTVGPTVAYSWTVPGVYTLTVTATNPCGETSDSFAVTVCLSVEGVEIEGPAGLLVGESGLYTATYAPPTATLPVTFAWDNGSAGPTAAYSWTIPGIYTLTVTATNPCAEISATFSVAVEEPIAGLQALNDSPTPLGDPTTLTATITAGSNVSFTWAFGDGSFGTGAVLTHTYPAVLTYTAVVTASNSVSTMTATTVVTVTERVYFIYLPIVLK